MNLHAGVSVVCQPPTGAAEDVDAARLGLAPGRSSFASVLACLVPAPAAGGGDIWVLDLQMVTR